ncbi:MAG: DinB family protein [Planctomycetes bacterium]|nr:DinB family protein [Planctomycetota bacterium]
MIFLKLTLPLLLLTSISLGSVAFQSDGAGQTRPAKKDAESQPASAPSDGRIGAKQREKLLKHFAEAEKQTLDSIDGISEAQWKFKPAADKWSVGEVVEHIIIVEEKSAADVEKSLKEKPDADWKDKKIANTEMLETMLLNRDFKVKAPAEVAPEGKLALADAAKRYKTARAASLKIAESKDALLRAHFVEHPFFSTMNSYQRLLVVALHNKRHNLQIAEVKANVDYPKK